MRQAKLNHDKSEHPGLEFLLNLDLVSDAAHILLHKPFITKQRFQVNEIFNSSLSIG